MTGHLVAVLHSPSLTSGQRTLSRVALAADLLDCATYSVTNLWPSPMRDVTKLNSVLVPGIPLVVGRSQIRSELESPTTTDVLLAYGVQLPTGSARAYFRDQIEWLEEFCALGDRRVWTLGGRAFHPSRWQRVTHREMPGLEFGDAVAELITLQRSGKLKAT